MALSQAEFEHQFRAATRRGEARLATQPVATDVRYDRRTRKIVVDLSNGCTLLLPPELAQGLAGASPEALATVRIVGPGTAIDWPKLDVQLSVGGLLAGTFGTAKWMAQRHRAAGEKPKSSAAKKRRPSKPKRS